MKRNLLKTLLASVLLLCGVGANAQELLDKFYFGVTGYDASGNPATVSATVYEDWSFVVKLADKNKLVGASKADVYAYMQSVPTLGVTTKREHKVTIETGVSVTPQKLSLWLPNIYGFTGTHVPVSVIDGSKKQDFVYCINAVNADNEIVATPCNVDETRAAWKIITDNVTNGSNDGDSYLKAKKDAFIKIGNEKLIFKNDVNILKGDWTVSQIREGMNNDLEYKKVVNDKKAVLYLPAGTELAIGGKIATLAKPATITLDCANVADRDLENKIGAARTKIGNSNADAIEGILGLIDTFIGLINKADVVPCEVLFDPTLNEDPEEPTAEDKLIVYSVANQNGVEMTKRDFENHRNSYPNAIAIVDEANAGLFEGVDNVVIKYTVGNNGNYYYECNNFILTDRKTGTDCSFYSPVDFVAVTGTYDRNITNTSATCCVPFELNATSSRKILTFSYYEPIIEDGEETGNAYAYFNSRQSVNAGVPCFIFDESKAGIHVTFDNTRIVGEPDNSANLQGSFVYTYDYSTPDYYGIGYLGTKIVLKKYSSADQSTPLRSVLYLGWSDMFNGGSNHSSANGAKSIDFAIIGEDGEVTTIDGVSLGSVNTKKGIYTINGAKVSDMSKPGLYIVDGVKKFVK